MAGDSETTLTKKGQVTIPVALRRAMGLKARDKVRFEYDPESGVAVLRRAAPALAEGYGAIDPRRRPENFGDVRLAFEESVAREVVGWDTDFDKLGEIVRVEP